jgi:putative transposase
VGFYRRLTDETVLQQIRALTNSRATCGYRRVWAMVNRTCRAGYNRKRIRRLMRRHGLMLPLRVHRRHGRPHLGQVQQPASNQRWCSDIFLIPCWSGGGALGRLRDRLPRSGGLRVDGVTPGR